MSRPMRAYSEGFTSRPSEMAWGCVSPQGWVPMPPKIPRRHPLLDSVGRIDDPCDRPKYGPPDWKPMPSFKPPREGYPNDMCNLDDYPREDEGEFPEAAAVLNVGQGTPQTLHVKLPPRVNCAGEDPKPSINECCATTRNLDVVEEKFNEISAPGEGDPEEEGSGKVVGPLEEREAGHSKKFTKCMSCCSPLLVGYPCRGVIDELPDEFTIPKRTDKCRKKGQELGDCGGKKGSATASGDWKDQPPVSGWEFIDKCRTCDYYPIQKNLVSRFNNPAWFKGYGCERPAHPFYVTTSSDVGRFGPNPHTMTQMYFPRAGAFTELLAITGMYRNRTLNTSNNKECLRNSLCC